MMTKLIGISGQAQSGKSTSTEYLLNLLGSEWTTDAFADPIKLMLQQIGVDTSEEAKSIVNPIFGKSPRQLYQLLGTDWGRNLVNEDLWINLLHQRNPRSKLIVSDIRMENEADYIRSNGGVLIHLRGRGGINTTHESENLINVIDGDYIVINDGTITGLKYQLQKIMINSNTL